MSYREKQVVHLPNFQSRSMRDEFRPKGLEKLLSREGEKRPAGRGVGHLAVFPGVHGPEGIRIKGAAAFAAAPFSEACPALMLAGMPRILLVPPDTRPPTLDLPVQLGRMTGADMLTPPAVALPFFFTPGNTAALREWLLEHAPGADALVVCLETLCLGGMIPARRVSDSLDVALERLQTLRDLRRLHPDLRIYAFGVVVRVAHDNDPHEEKPYYGEWGRPLRAYSTAFDRHERHGAGERRALDEAKSAIPDDILADWLGTRERNRALHLAAMDLLKEGILTHLSVTLDDTSEYGLAAYDRRMLEARADELGLWDAFDIYPGADEVPCALLTRALRSGLPPAKAWVSYSGTLGAAAGMIYEQEFPERSESVM